MSLTKTTIATTAEHVGKRLDQFLVSQLPETSRARVQQLIAQAKVTVNGRLCPDWIVTGKVTPLIEKPVPCHVTLETVIGEEPAVSIPV